MRLILTLFCCSLAAPVSGATHIVDVGPGMSFSPPTITIAVGDTIKFINHGGLHNAKANDNSFRCANGCDADGGNGAASYNLWVATHTFLTTGTIGYYCETHGTPTTGMRGTIVVQPTTPVELQSFSVD
jgi:plastocyanin